MLKLTITFLAGALALAGSSALAFELPDNGSKNFSASGDTPTYFKNETVPVSARTADTTEGDWTAADEAAPARSLAEPALPGHPSGGHRHGRYASVQRSWKHIVGSSSGEATSGPFVKSHAGRSTGTALAHNVTTQAGKAPSSAAKTSSARHGRAGARRA